MCDEFSWLMQAGLFVHEQEQQKVQHAEKENYDAKSEGKKSVVDKIRARKKEEKLRGDELVEFTRSQCFCTRCGSCELANLTLLKGGCDHLLCTECLNGIKSREILLGNGLVLAVCPVCKTDISTDAVGERPEYLVHFLEQQSSRGINGTDNDIDYRSIVVADIHLVSRVYWTRMRVLLCRQSETLAASYAKFQESQVAVQKSSGNAKGCEQNCAKAKLLLADARTEYEKALRLFESLESNVSGNSDVTLNETQPLNLERFRSANGKFLALKKLQSASKQHATLEIALNESQEALQKCIHGQDAARAAFEHCTKNMDTSYTTAFRQFDMIKKQLRETRSLLPDATGAETSERDMDEQFTLHTTIIRDLDDAKWHFQQNLVYPVDIPINIELTLKALDEELRSQLQVSDTNLAGSVLGAAEQQAASINAALKFDGFISPQRWDQFPTKIVPDDCPTIQEAVKSLWRSCGRVIVKAGVFKEYILLEGLVKICCEDAASTVCINPLSESHGTAIEVIGGFCMISNVMIESVSAKSDAPLIFCRSGNIQLERCVLKSDLAATVFAIGSKTGCHFDRCRFFGGQNCNGLVRLSQGSNCVLTNCEMEDVNPGGRGFVMGDSGTKLSMTKCKLNVQNQCVSSSAGMVVASDCDFICSGIALRGSSLHSSFDLSNSTFNLTKDSSMGISSSHGQQTSLSDCKFFNGMCGLMIDSEAICDVKNSTFAGCKFGCRSRDSSLNLTNCSMHDCQKCVYSFGPKGKIHAKDSKFEKVTLNCFECVSESSITLERCIVENSASCAIKATASSSILLTDCNFINCNTKVSVATGSSRITMASCNFNSMSGNGLDFSDNSVGILDNIVFRRCSGIGIQLADSTLRMTSAQMSTVLSHCILCKHGSSLDAIDCMFEFCNGFSVAIESSDSIVTEFKAQSLVDKIVVRNS